jgi:hypothetical protein
MTRHDDGHGRRAGPAPDLQSGFVNNLRVGRVLNRSEAFGARIIQKNEVP